LRLGFVPLKTFDPVSRVLGTALDDARLPSMRQPLRTMPLLEEFAGTRGSAERGMYTLAPCLCCTWKVPKRNPVAHQRCTLLRQTVTAAHRRYARPSTGGQLARAVAGPTSRGGDLPGLRGALRDSEKSSKIASMISTFLLEPLS
jgi:hypothetical protein